ncbi:DUF4394 domain-containing protein [Aquibaculum arenosum]|uniref:DUF4394 domain-containing protein n=1 Tax=Aquibaculum arenosum TaxID=3032591 RepID=A0ABT5YMJ3_9PROT|nr:DUF4394 domain-containing protein [Fodinicurvata sp. CAU 1616]MDF2096072.1 DUF4394 domain-containing protein [Fodinicurvata sp. CAU 1616]
MSALQALGLTIRQELLHLDLDSGVIGERRRLANVEDLRGLLLALDRRPSDGRIYALTGLTEMTDRMSLLPLPPGATRSADFRQQVNEVGLDLPLPENALIAFDPVQDNLRAVTPSGRSFRVDPESGALQADVSLSLWDGRGRPRLSAIAYARGLPDARQAPLYLLDVGQRALHVEDPREPGRVEYIGALGIDLRELSAFRIFSTPERGDTAILVDGHRIYTVDLLTGRAWDRGSFGAQDLVITDMAPLFEY